MINIGILLFKSLASGFNSPSVETLIFNYIARLYNFIKHYCSQLFTSLAHSKPSNVIQHLDDTYACIHYAGIILGIIGYKKNQE